MNVDRAAGALLIDLPIAFDTFILLLARLFDCLTQTRLDSGRPDERLS